MTAVGKHDAVRAGESITMPTWTRPQVHHVDAAAGASMIAAVFGSVVYSNFAIHHSTSRVSETASLESEPE